MTEPSDVRLTRQLTVPSGDALIDPLRFMRRTARQKTLICRKNLEVTPPVKEDVRQSYLEPFNGPGGAMGDSPPALGGRFYYVKGILKRNPTLVGDQYERYGWNGDSVWIERDTAWPDVPAGCPAGFNAFDAREYGDRWWARRPTQIGVPETRRATIMPFRSGDEADACTYHPGPGDCNRVETETQEVVRTYRSWGGDICPHGEEIESIGIRQYDQVGNLVEVFWYALGWGWVYFENLRPTTDNPSLLWNEFDDDSGPVQRKWRCEGLGQSRETYKAEYYFYDYSAMGHNPKDGLLSSPPSRMMSGFESTYAVRVLNTGSLSWLAADNTRLVVTLTRLYSGTEERRWVHALSADVPVGQYATIVVRVESRDAGLFVLNHRLFSSAENGFNQDYSALAIVRPVVIASNAQIAMLIDTTGSMSDDIEAVKAAAGDIARALVPHGVEMAIVDYRDFPEPPYGAPGDYPYHDVMPFSASETDIVQGLNALALGSGGDTPEAVYSGLMHTIDGSSLGGWVEGARRFIIAIGDAAAHDPEPRTKYTAQTVIEAAGWDASAEAVLDEAGGVEASAVADERVTIHSVLLGNDPDALACFTALSRGTRGRVFRAGNPTDIAKAILDAIDDIIPTPTVGNTYRVGVADSHAFYRTNILQQSAAVTCRYPQISPAVFHEERNRTYIAYTAGLDGADPEGRTFTAENPWIVAFDHSTETWEGPAQIGDVRPPRPRRDCHDYPQILIDSHGYLHVFHTFHMTGPNIAHFKSRAPHDVSGRWSRSEIPNTSRNTYGAAFKSKEGHFYVFYRDTVWYQQASEGVPESWYEPEMYVKSMDEGRTWSEPRLLIDPGRPRASDASDRARQVTRLINDNGWNTIYVSSLAQDLARNRLYIDFTATSQHQEQWGNRLMVCFDMYRDEVLTIKGRSLGSRIERPEYLEDDGEGVRVYTGRFVTKHMDAYGHELTQAIVIEDDDHGYPTLYYVRFESNNPWLGAGDAGFYRSGWDRLRRARWTGSHWDDDYVSGVADPAADPFIQYDELTKRRRETSHIWAAEHRGDDGTFLYVKTKWGGVPFWLYPNGGRRPEYEWDPIYDYQFPGRVFSTSWPFTTHVRMFGDHHPWEVRGISNFSLVPGGHPTIKATMRLPKYTKLMPTTGGAGVLDQYAIGADYVWGEEPLQPLRPDREPLGEEGSSADPS